MNNYIKAIEKRISVRSYKDEILDATEASVVQMAIDECNKDSDLNISLILDANEAFRSFRKTYGLFKGVRSIIVLKGKKDDKNLFEKAGYYGEKLVLMATTINLGTCFVAGTYNKKSKIFNLNNDEELVCLITIGKPSEKIPFMNKLITKAMHRKSKEAKDFYESNIIVPGWFISSIEAVKRAPSAINSQKVRFRYSDNEVKVFVPLTAATDMIDLGIAKLHFEVLCNRKFVLGNNAKLN